MLISIETNIPCDFPGGCPASYFPSGLAHGIPLLSLFYKTEMNNKRGGSRISGKGVRKYNCMGFA